MVALLAALAALAAVGFIYLRVRNRTRWRRMIDAYADRQIAQARRSLRQPV